MPLLAIASRKPRFKAAVLPLASMIGAKVSPGHPWESASGTVALVILAHDPPVLPDPSITGRDGTFVLLAPLCVSFPAARAFPERALVF